MKKHYLLSLALVGCLASCEIQDTPEDTILDQDSSVKLKMVKVEIDAVPKLQTSGLTSKKSSGLQAHVGQLNKLLVPYGVQLEKMEYYSADGAGQTVFFSDRGNKRLGSDFVPNDPRNGYDGTDIPYIIDGTQLMTTSGLDTEEPIHEVMDTWETVTCSQGLNLPFAGKTETDFGFVSDFFFDFGGSEGFFPGAIVSAGVLPSEFFDLLTPETGDGGTFILGVTFTLSYLEDINGDGVGDVAIKEIYYNDAFDWQDRVATGEGVDFHTVALHETGHALSQGHFGKVSRTESNGKFHFSPRAVMNAGYSGVNRVIEQTDEAGHCSNWGNWPNN